MNEFDIIERYFKPLGDSTAHIALGIGDDAAVLDVPAGEQIVVTTDTQVESVHFPAAADPAAVAYRSCAAALSDIAAMGASARWLSLALTLPRADANWLQGFAAGATEAIGFAGAVLVGGDTTSGPLTITWNIIGTVPRDAALRRDGARAGDALYVSGNLGSARAALDLLASRDGDNPSLHPVLARYWHPAPRLALGTQLRGLASSCIDISDGLLADATHLARRSDVGVEIVSSELPLLPELVALVGTERAREFALTGGDDYELCFSVPPACERELLQLATKSDVPLSRVGRITRGSDVRVIGSDGRPAPTTRAGYRHFD
jgi:thiamine-monophosphate kinase